MSRTQAFPSLRTPQLSDKWGARVALAYRRGVLTYRDVCFTGQLWAGSEGGAGRVGVRGGCFLLLAVRVVEFSVLGRCHVGLLFEGGVKS
jgi:hypothetical protein